MRRLLIPFVFLLMSCGQTAPEPAVPYIVADISIPKIAAQNAWTIDYNNSLIAFDAVEKGESFEGRFNRFNIAVDLDLKNPEGGKIDAIIDLGSVFAGNEDRDKVLKDSEMFFVRKFPTANFQSNDIKRLGEGRYEARGELSLKAVTKNIVLPFSISQNENKTIVTAEYKMSRLDFNIGTGSFMSDKYVGYPVTIRIELQARKDNVEESLQ